MNSHWNAWFPPQACCVPASLSPIPGEMPGQKLRGLLVFPSIFSCTFYIQNMLQICPLPWRLGGRSLYFSAAFFVAWSPHCPFAFPPESWAVHAAASRGEQKSPTRKASGIPGPEPTRIPHRAHTPAHSSPSPAHGEQCRTSASTLYEPRLHLFRNASALPFRQLLIPYLPGDAFLTASKQCVCLSDLHC